MKFLKPCFLAFAVLFSASCSSVKKFKIIGPDKIQINQILNVSTDLENNSFDKIVYILNNKIVGNQEELALNISDYRLGKHKLKVTATIGKKEVSEEKTIIFLSDQKPKILKFEVVDSFPHDTKAYTQGLEFYNDKLYESTGKNGESNIREVEISTGKVIQQQNLANKYFGEGITFFNDKLFQLTWQAKTGFVYDANTLKVTGQFNYHNSKEGWGLTHNDQNLIKSDGTEKIWFLNPENGKEERYIEIYTDERKVNKLNELEYVNGKIYANVWMKNAILIINPKNGAIESIINMKNLTLHLDDKSIKNDRDRVLNGIAYNNKTKKLYVTGKYWDKLFEIKITE